MNEEKKPNGEIVLQGRFWKWLDNFWYHYKWVTIGVAVALVILLVCILQTCSKEKEDLMMTYAGPTVLSVSELEQVSEVMNSVMPYDADENGKKHTAWMTYQIYSEDQIRELTETNTEGKVTQTVDRSFNSDQYSVFNNYLKTGESSIFLLDPWLYESLATTDHLMPLSEVLETVPEGAVGECGIRLGDTDLYEKYAVLRLLPADTVICLMKQYVIGRSSDEEQYRFECDMFRAIVTYQNEG